MNSNEFTNWLRGFLAGCGPELNKDQTAKLKETLKEVVDVYCPQQIQPTIPYNPPGTSPYSPPWTIGDPPNPIWYTTSSTFNKNDVKE
jgi:hypothetical protein